MDQDSSVSAGQTESCKNHGAHLRKQNDQDPARRDGLHRLRTQAVDPGEYPANGHANETVDEAIKVNIHEREHAGHAANAN